MFPDLLTKTDFKIARSCPTKLYYHRQRYPSASDESEYMELLKEGGHMLGEIARIQLPHGVYIGLDEGLEIASARTAEALRQENVTLFEAVIVHEKMLAVVDILEKRGRDLNLIEVKSKSYDSSQENQIVGKKGQILAGWQEYLEDVTFQKLVVDLAYPECKVVPYLLLPDKSKRTTIEGLAGDFLVVPQQRSPFRPFRVEYLGDKERLRTDRILARVNVEDASAFVMPLVMQEARRFCAMISPTLTREQYHLGKHCKECEYRSAIREKSGFHQCWGTLADTNPHIFDLYFGGALKKDGKFLFDELISQRKVSLYDIPDEAIKGKRGERQAIQIQCTRANQEWIDPHLKVSLEQFSYPLHFIDFETSTSALPYHKGMRPFEPIAFQWSCHTIHEPGAAPAHREWINVEDTFPSFQFAETLMNTLSEEGTIFIWARHENTMLGEIRRQMHDYDYDRPSLAEWLDRVVTTDESPGRLVDMNALCLSHYFHPQMKGRTSIKYVLPAIWNNNEYLHQLPFLQRYVKRDAQGAVLSPYEVLAPIEIAGVSQAVREGTGAIIAYKEMMFGLSKGDSEKKERWATLLRQYCELDTLAMVIIFLHWQKLCEAL